MKSYKDVRKELAETMGPTDGAPAPCGFCREMTPHETLRNFGARCGRCFSAYCRAVPELPKADVKREDVGERQYAARRLATWEARHMERMTPAQRDFLEACRRAAGASAEA